MKKILLILSLILIAYLNCNSQVWHRANGMSENILSLAVKNNVIYALVSKDGLFSSSDYGKTWINNGFGYIMDIPYSHFDIKSKIIVSGNIIYVGLQYTGLFYSSDDGINWNEINLPNKKLNQFDIYENNIVINTDSGLFISKDNGLSWNKINIDLFDDINSLKINDSTILIGGNYRIYISNDYGYTWSNYYNGLNCYNIISLAIIDDTIYIGSENSGIFKSTDKGQNWFDINNGLTYFKVNSIFIDGNNIFAGTDGKGIFMSTDYGEHWARLNNDYDEDYDDINSIAVINNNVFAGAFRELLFSSDHGKNWDIVKNGVGEQVDFLCSDKSNVLASSGEGLYLSTNHGLSWSHISQNFYQKEPFSTRVSAISSVGDKLFVGVRFRGIYSSTNKGTTWEVQSNGIPESAIVETFAVNDGKIYAGLEGDGIYMSSDTGRNWYYVNNVFPYGITVYSIAIKDSLIFVGTVDGMYLSTDNGVNWSQSGKEIYEKQVYTCLIHDNTIYAGTKDFGILKSIDKGQNWTQTTIGKLSISSLTVCGNTVYAGTRGAGVFYSTNNGNIWVQKLKGLKSYDIQNLISIGDTVIAMTDKSGLFFTTHKSDSWTFIDKIGGSALYDNKNEIYLGYFDGVVKSSDFGQTWIILDSGLYKKEYLCFWDNVAIEDSNIIIVDDKHDFHHSSNLGKSWSLGNNGIKEYVRTLELHKNILYASTVKGFYKSSDLGHTWIKSDKGLVDSMLWTFSFDKGRILIRSDDKFYISFDSADTWTQLSDFPPNFSITDYELSDNYIIVSTYGEGIILSSDLGKTWIYGSVNPLYTLLVTDIEAKDNIVFAGCLFDSMYYSTDNGHNWRVANSGIWDYNYNDVCVLTLAISDDNYVYASPHSNGVYMLNIDDITGVDEKPIKENESFTFYPNPSSDHIFIKCRDGLINQNIKIYNILGNTIWQGVLISETMRIDVSSFPSSVYYINVNGSTKMFVKN